VPVSFGRRGAVTLSKLWNSRAWEYIRQHRVLSIAAGHVIVMTVLGMMLFSSAFGTPLFGAFAQTPCANGDQVYSVMGGDTLGAIGSRYGVTWQRLASYNRLANANLIYINEHICIPGKAATGYTAPAMPLTSLNPIHGLGNLFPYGQCTWWANQRYYQLHGIFVPWTTNANALQWNARAYDFHWRVSSQPSVGAILDLQPWVQGAYGLGHVAVVEQVLGNGHVIASSMNWGITYWRVTDAEFTPGPGVTFITAY